MDDKLEFEIEITTTWYYELKLRMLAFLSNFMDVSVWTENFLQDVQDNQKRYIKIKIVESKGKQMETIVDEYKDYILPGSNVSAGFLDEHTLYKFPNNYGASVITGKASHGLEAARIYFDDGDNYSLSHEEPSGYLTQEELADFLKEIKEME